MHVAVLGQSAANSASARTGSPRRPRSQTHSPDRRRWVRRRAARRRRVRQRVLHVARPARQTSGDGHHDLAFAGRALTEAVDARLASRTAIVRAAGHVLAAIGVRIDRPGHVVCGRRIALLIRRTRGSLVARNRLARAGRVATETRIATGCRARHIAHRADAALAARVCDRLTMLARRTALIGRAVLARPDPACRSFVGTDAGEVARTVALAVARVTDGPACTENDRCQDPETLHHASRSATIAPTRAAVIFTCSNTEATDL